MMFALNGRRGMGVARLSVLLQRRNPWQLHRGSLDATAQGGNLLHRCQQRGWDGELWLIAHTATSSPLIGQPVYSQFENRYDNNLNQETFENYLKAKRNGTS